jgi:hypothetical protein
MWTLLFKKSLIHFSFAPYEKKIELKNVNIKGLEPFKTKRYNLIQAPWT